MRSATDTDAVAPSLTGKTLDEYAARRRKLFCKRATVVATMEDVGDHIDHAVKVAGVDTWAWGVIFDGIAATANGLEDVSKDAGPGRLLLKGGYADGDLKTFLERTLSG